MGHDGVIRPERLEDIIVHDLVTTLSEAEDVDVLDLTPPLNDVIDVDALSQLLRDGDETLRVTFEYRQWKVEVRGDGAVDTSVIVGEE